MKYINKFYLLVFIVILSFNVSACKKEEKNIPKNNLTDNNAVIVDTPVDKDTDNKQTEENNNNIVNNDSINVISDDEMILNYFNNLKDEVNNLINSDTIDGVKIKCKNYFIIIVDFLFYDGTINNITFNTLKDETKLKLIDIALKIDNLIMSKFPNYKEDINSDVKYLYDKASALLHSGKTNLEEYVIEKIGDDKYQDVIDSINVVKENDIKTWDNIKDYTNNIYEEGKEKLDNWYQNFKNK